MELNIRRTSSKVLFILAFITGVIHIIFAFVEALPFFQSFIALEDLWLIFKYVFSAPGSLWHHLVYGSTVATGALAGLLAVFGKIISIMAPPILILLAYYLNHTENNQAGCICGIALLIINLLGGVFLGSLEGLVQLVLDIGFPLLIMAYSVSDGEYRYRFVWLVICIVLCACLLGFFFLTPVSVRGILMLLTHLLAFLSFPFGKKALEEADVVYSGRKTIVEEKEPSMWWHYVNTYVLFPLCTLMGLIITYAYITIAKDMSKPFSQAGNLLLRALGGIFPYLIVLMYGFSVYMAIRCIIDLHNKNESAIGRMRTYHLYCMAIYFFIAMIMFVLYKTIAHFTLGLLLFLANIILLAINAAYYTRIRHLLSA